VINIEAGGLGDRAGQIMIANQQQGGDFFGEALDPAGEFALLGGIGIAGLECVAANTARSALCASA
jgi:hypothetical protein